MCNSLMFVNGTPVGDFPAHKDTQNQNNGTARNTDDLSPYHASSHDESPLPPLPTSPPPQSPIMDQDYWNARTD